MRMWSAWCMNFDERIRRVVLDTSTLVSAAIRTRSAPDQALSKALDSCFLCASEKTLDELQQVLERGRFDRYRDLESRRAFVAMIRLHSHLFAVDLAGLWEVVPPCHDPKDNQFLALARAAEADAIVSSDHDLLVLNPWRGVRILSSLLQRYLPARAGKRNRRDHSGAPTGLWLVLAAFPRIPPSLRSGSILGYYRRPRRGQIIVLAIDFCKWLYRPPAILSGNQGRYLPWCNGVFS